MASGEWRMANGESKCASNGTSMTEEKETGYLISYLLWQCTNIYTRAMLPADVNKTDAYQRSCRFKVAAQEVVVTRHGGTGTASQICKLQRNGRWAAMCPKP
ncbi:hypothetical protein ACLOJK_031661 [Asimina triloba]